MVAIAAAEGSDESDAIARGAVKWKGEVDNDASAAPLRKSVEEEEEVAAVPLPRSAAVNASLAPVMADALETRACCCSCCL